MDNDDVSNLNEMEEGSTETPMSAAYWNPVLRAVKRHDAMTCQPKELAEFKKSEGNAKLVFQTITTLGMENGELQSFEVVARRVATETQA